MGSNQKVGNFREAIFSMPDKQQLHGYQLYPLAEASAEDLKVYPFPDGADPSRLRGLREEVTQAQEHTSYTLSTGIGGVVYETCWYMRGLERWYMDMMEDPFFCEALLDRVLEF